MKQTITFTLILILSTILIGQKSWSDVDDMDPNSSVVTGTAIDVIPLLIPDIGVDFYNDEGMLMANCDVSSEIFVEDFNTTLIDANFAAACSAGGLSSTTDNNCFGSESVVPGFELNTDNMDDLVVMTPPFIGVPQIAIGPNSPDENSIFTFSVPVNLVSFEFITPVDNSFEFTVEVFGASGSLGSTSITSNGNVPVFFGALASENITSVTIFNPSLASELFTKLSFGVCEAPLVEIPTIGQWAIIGLSLMLLIFGILSIRDKKQLLSIINFKTNP